MPALLSSLNVFCAPASAAWSDLELITKALNYAGEAKEEIAPRDSPYRHCRERALSFSSLPPQVGKSENGLNEVRLARGGSIVVTFLHNGMAYDGVKCQVMVQMDHKGRLKRVQTKRNS